MSATHVSHPTPSTAPTLYLAFDLGWTSWNLAFSTGMAQKPRLRTIPARDLEGLQREIQRARQRFGLPDDAPVVSCYEAGRDGFWLHRYLIQRGVENRVVDAASIEVNRRARRAKSDRIDVAKLLNMLIRYYGGEHKVWSVVNVPSPEDEDRRQPHRELMAVKGERTEHSNRIKGLLASLGLEVTVDEHLAKSLSQLRQWDGSPVPAEMTARILREFERWSLADRQARDLENAQRRAFRDDETAHVEKMRRLLDLRAIGPMSATLFVREFFGWRRDQEPPRAGKPGGLDADAVRQRRQSARTGDQQGGEPACAVDDGGDCLGLASVATQQRVEPVVSAAVRLGQRAGEEGGDRGAGEEAVDRSVALPGAWRSARGCGVHAVGEEAQRPVAGASDGGVLDVNKDVRL